MIKILTYKNYKNTIRKIKDALNHSNELYEVFPQYSYKEIKLLEDKLKMLENKVEILEEKIEEFILDFTLSDGKRMSLENCSDHLSVKLWTENGEYMGEITWDIDSIAEMLFTE